MFRFKPGQLVLPAIDRMRVYSLATHNYALWREIDKGLYLRPCEDCYTAAKHKDLAEVLEDLQPGQKARFYNPSPFTIFRRKTPSYGKTQLGLYLGNNVALFEEMRVSLAGNRGKFEIYIG